MFDLQRRFSEGYWRDSEIDIRTDRGQRKVARENALGAHSEIDEMLRALSGWKAHRDEDESCSVVKSNLVEEACDAVKYILGIMVAFDVHPDEFLKVYEAKSALVELRYEQDRQLRRLIEERLPCVAVDLDGVIYPYPSRFYKYCENHHLDIVDGVPHPYKENLKPSDYEMLKTSYRESGYKSRGVPVEGTDELMSCLNRMYGGDIIILSARPVKDVMRIATDTVDWINKNDIPYRAVLFNEDKAVYAARRLPTLDMLIDDDYGQCKRAALQGVDKVMWIAGNDRREAPEGCTKLQSIIDCVKYLEGEHDAP